MSIVSEVKCARCDRNYSGVRSRCPYCGARRIGSGKYSEEGDNSNGKMIIGILILAVLVVAAGVLLFTTPTVEAEAISSPGNSDSEQEYVGLPSETDNVSFDGPGASAEPSDNSPESESEDLTTTPPQVRSVEITFAGVRNEDFTAGVGEQVSLRAKVEPAGADFEEEIVWTSSDENVFQVVPTPDGTGATVTVIGSTSAPGLATLTVSIGGVQAECIVRVRGR